MVDSRLSFMSTDQIGPTKYRTIWISDIHLGTAGCKAPSLLDFLKHTEADTIYLVGDIIDLVDVSTDGLRIFGFTKSVDRV